ncbi:hypothetical protein CEXT_115921 [Caerostris extrusa]|uniref:Uncharacterized protein n=1 Tax=Caerostris extrusa TaxID=172846 RepID=A0AAV4T7F0_CAEEX|nr:hypothetical protein CEXT_115921 [Caerostris extrusa]
MRKCQDAHLLLEGKTIRGIKVKLMPINVLQRYHFLIAHHAVRKADLCRPRCRHADDRRFVPEAEATPHHHRRGHGLPALLTAGIIAKVLEHQHHGCHHHHG